MNQDKNPLIGAMRAIVAELLPRIQFMGDTEYMVHAQSGDAPIVSFVDLKPTDSTLGMPTLPRVPFRGAPGIAAQLAPGTRVIVRFVNSDPGRPYVAAIIGQDSDTFVPLRVRLDASELVHVGEHAAEVKLSTGAQFLALANLVDLRLREVAFAFASAAVSPGDGGAALQAAAKTFLVDHDWNALTLLPPSTAAEKVKGT